MKQTIAVVDYGMGNLRSVVKALEFVADDQTRVILTANPDEVRRADRVVFPGQGAARDCMRALHESELDSVVLQSAREKPFLGICMGMQVLMGHSQENGGVDGLKLFAGDVVRFEERMNGERFKIPHMGWNVVRQTHEHALWQGIDDQSYFYFVHSYYVVPEDVALVAATTDYGLHFTSAIARDNVFAIQCHPEKSARAGLALLKNFVRWDV